MCGLVWVQTLIKSCKRAFTSCLPLQEEEDGGQRSSPLFCCHRGSLCWVSADQLLRLRVYVWTFLCLLVSLSYPQSAGAGARRATWVLLPLRNVHTSNTVSNIEMCLDLFILFIRWTDKSSIFGINLTAGFSYGGPKGQSTIKFHRRRQQKRKGDQIWTKSEKNIFFKCFMT